MIDIRAVSFQASLMNQHNLSALTATPDGILIHGLPLTKSASWHLSLQSQRYVQRASELLQEVRPEDWDNHTPHTMNNVPVLAKVNMLLALASPRLLDKAGFNLGQPRDDHGRWTDEEGVTAADRKNPRFKGMTNTQIKKQKFVDAHLAVTEKAAKELNVPAANMLGVSALESKWGLGDFVLDGSTVAESTNSYFGMHAPAPLMDGTTQIGNGPGAVAGFASYQDALNSFVARYGSMIHGVSDPKQFATILQRQGKFGMDPTTGGYLPDYVPNLVSTIHHLSSVIDYAKKNPN